MSQSRSRYLRWGASVVVVAAVAVMGWYVGSRARDAAPQSDHAAAEPDTAGGIYRDIAGRVVRVNPETESFTVDHEAIPGFMGAMVMDLKVAEPAELMNLKQGDQVLFDLVRIEGQYRVVRIRRQSSETPQSRPDSAADSPADPLGRGDLVPDLVLLDTQGQPFRLREMKQRQKLITFFYARCPLKTFCPAQSARLARLQRHLADTGSDVHLLSLTLDAEHDRPDVLAGYAERFNADPARWTLAGTDDPEAIRRFAHRAGAQIHRLDDSFQIDHALVVLRVDGNRIVDRLYGLDAVDRLVQGMSPTRSDAADNPLN